MRRSLGDGVELDDDRERIDAGAVHDYLSNHSYWARERTREDVDHSLTRSARVIGLYANGGQIGFARVISDGVHIAHLCDVYVLEPYRGRGYGVELVREAVELGP